MASNYTWSKTELYNKDGIQIFIIRANENHRKVAYEIVENGIARKVKRDVVDPYLDPNYAERKAAKEKRIATYKAHKAFRSNMADWKEELNFTWI
jgi:hypothetical protein